EQRIDGPLDQRGQVAARHGVAEQVSQLLDLGAELGADGELHPVARRRERLEARTSRGWERATRLRTCSGGRRRWRGDRLDTLGEVRAGKPASQELLDLTACLTAGLGEQGLGVLLAQMIGEQEEAGQMQ